MSGPFSNTPSHEADDYFDAANRATYYGNQDAANLLSDHANHLLEREAHEDRTASNDGPVDYGPYGQPPVSHGHDEYYG